MILYEVIDAWRSYTLLVKEIPGDYDDIFQDVLGGSTPDRFNKEVIMLIQKRIFIREDVLPIVPGGFGSFFESLTADTIQKKVRRSLENHFPNRRPLIRYILCHCPLQDSISTI